MSGWQENLEIVGPELFLRYRKRLMWPGIAIEIRRDYPGLSILDVLVRVHAGRRIIQAGEDFRALHAIRTGRWSRICREHDTPCPRDEGRRDRASRILVTLGGVLFTAFCVLSLLASISAGKGYWLVPAFGVTLAVTLVWWRNQSGPASSARPGDAQSPNARGHAHDRHDAAASV